MKRLLFTLSLLLLPMLANAASLKWQDNSTDETGFRVYRSGTIGGAWTLVGELPANTVTYTDVNGGVGNCWYVTAYNGAGESAPTNTACLLLVVPTSPGTLGVVP